MIDRAAEQDLPNILALQRAAFREEAEFVGDMNIKPMAQTLDDLRQEFGKAVILKYEENGTIIGSVRAYPENGTCYINRLIVHPDHWSKGIGTALMDAVELEFKDADRFELFTRTDHRRTRPFYQRLGYLPFKEEKVSQTLTFVYLEKKNQKK
ncbi:MAG: putative acetyltransferase [Methanomassiliicoccales archaeon PtaU1.Bin124]|nr:MAG: putative acetyltransferase [Methanomassiliicoccales archaeon PtaU1.Bin124]